MERAAVVAEADNEAPVVLESQDPGHHTGFDSRPRGEGRCYYDRLVVPFKHDRSGDMMAVIEPVVIVRVDDIGEAFVVAFDYEVRSPAGVWRLRPDPWHRVWLEVTVADGFGPLGWHLVTPSTGFRWRGATPEDDRKMAAGTGGAAEFIDATVIWEYAVSSGHQLQGLRRGTYGLRLSEELPRGYGRREYRNMRLTVRKL